MRNLQWKKVDKIYVLYSNGEALITLHLNLIGTSKFIINGKDYTISKKGFWNPVIHIDAGEEHILTLTHSLWGNTGKVVFNDAKTYTSHFKTGSAFKFRFLNDEREILSYSSTVVDNKRSLNFQVTEALLDADKFLILAALGMKIFNSLFKEISDDDAAILLLLTTA